jgi:hypothetical protein
MIDEEEESNRKIINESFISKYFLDIDRKYSIAFYLTGIMRFSIFEKILTNYLFQSKKESKDYTLYPLLDSIIEQPKKKSLFISYLKYYIDMLEEDNPLFFFAEISKEIIRLLKNEDLSIVKFDDYILKIEFLLAWHFENNFYPKSIFEQFESMCNDNIYLQRGLTNYIYSINSIDTIEKFLRIFEKQNLLTRIEGGLELVNDLFCSEKIYYFYCDKTGKKKLICGNFVKYLIQQLNTKIDRFKNNKVNSYEIENYIMMNLYMINEVITNYSFYLYKEPELVEIFNLIEKYKTWPCPISNYCNNLMENIINENSFQGISVLNKLRQTYYIDLLDKDVTSIELKHFRYTLIVNSNEWEKRHSDGISSDYFNLFKFLTYLLEHPKNKNHKKLLIKELLIKVLITIVYNSSQPFTDETFKKIYKHYLPNYKTIHDENNKKEDTEKIKSALDKMLKIIDVGFDKMITDFDKEINILANKIITLDSFGGRTNVEDDDTNILDNEFLLPIDSMRNYLKPEYCELKKIYRDANNEYNVLELFDTYIRQFTLVVNTYFKYLLKDSEDQMIQNNLNTMRRNFYENFRINILLVEEENTINDFIENLQKRVFSVIDKKISDDDFNKFWSKFVDEKNEIIPKFLLFLVPSYESSESHPFRILTEDNGLKNKETYLCEYIANNDYIYKNLIFMPFAATPDLEPDFQQTINEAKEKNSLPKDADPLMTPSLNIIYSFLEKPLDKYLGDSNGIFNLNLYKISINEKVIEKVFWKNVEFLDKNNDNSRMTKLTLTCVDYLGIEYKEVKEIKIGNANFNIKIFNIFFKGDVPFNYNMNSNNGWLEMFLDDKYDFNDAEKFINFQSFLNNNKKTRYYEELNMHQTDIETRYKNYKIKSILIESNSPSICIRCDDYYDVSYYEKIDLTTNKKNSGELKLKIKIEPYQVNEEEYTLPIATFVTI